MLTNYSQLNWKPVHDLVFIRELPVTLDSVIIPGIDLNRSKENSPILYGIVEAIGPEVTDMQVGDRVAYEIHAGEFRMPGDDEVRIMYERDVAWICEQQTLIQNTCEGCHVAPSQCPGPDVGGNPVCFVRVHTEPPCPGIDLGDDGCTATGGDCPTCGR